MKFRNSSWSKRGYFMPTVSLTRVGPRSEGAGGRRPTPPPPPPPSCSTLTTTTTSLSHALHPFHHHHDTHQHSTLINTNNCTSLHPPLLHRSFPHPSHYSTPRSFQRAYPASTTLHPIQLHLQHRHFHHHQHRSFSIAAFYYISTRLSHLLLVSYFAVTTGRRLH